MDIKVKTPIEVIREARKFLNIVDDQKYRRKQQIEFTGKDKEELEVSLDGLIKAIDDFKEAVGI